MNNESVFFLPVTVYDGITAPAGISLVAADVVSLPATNQSKKLTYILKQRVGNDSAGLYVLTNNMWVYALDLSSLSAAVVAGSLIKVFANTQTAVPVVAGSTTFRNGVTVLPSATVVPASDGSVWCIVASATASEVSDNGVLV